MYRSGKKSGSTASVITRDIMVWMIIMNMCIRMIDPAANPIALESWSLWKSGPTTTAPPVSWTTCGWKTESSEASSVGITDTEFIGFVEFVEFIEFIEFVGFIEFIAFVGFVELIELIGRRKNGRRWRVCGERLKVKG